MFYLQQTFEFAVKAGAGFLIFWSAQLVPFEDNLPVALLFLILSLSSLIYLVKNAFQGVLSLFNWVKIRPFMFKAVMQMNWTQRGCSFAIYFVRFLGSCLKEYLKFTFIGALRFAFRVICLLFAQSLSPSQTLHPHYVSSGSKDNMVRSGQYVLCRKCGSRLPEGAHYKSASPICHRCC